MLIAVALVILLSLGLAWTVACPLQRRRDASARAAGVGWAREADGRRRDLRETLDRSLAALKEIEFDHRSGHLSDEDFAALDAAERARAVELMRRLDEIEGVNVRAPRAIPPAYAGSTPPTPGGETPSQGQLDGEEVSFGESSTRTGLP